MALEDEMKRLADLVEKQNDYLQQMVTIASGRANGGATAAAAPKDETGAPKRTRRTKEQMEADAAAAAKGGSKASDGPSFEDAQEVSSEWMGEFDKKLFDADGEPRELDEEGEAMMNKRNNRRKFIKACIDKLGGVKLGDLTDPDDRAKFIKWIEMKKAGKDPFAPPPRDDDI